MNCREKKVYVQQYLLQRSLMDEKNNVEINPFFTVAYDWSNVEHAFSTLQRLVYASHGTCGMQVDIHISYNVINFLWIIFVHKHI